MKTMPVWAGWFTANTHCNCVFSRWVLEHKPVAEEDVVILGRDAQFIVLCDVCGDHANTSLSHDAPYANKVIIVTPAVGDNIGHPSYRLR
jgi:hypothetical protein